MIIAIYFLLLFFLATSKQTALNQLLLPTVLILIFDLVSGIKNIVVSHTVWNSWVYILEELP